MSTRLWLQRCLRAVAFCVAVVGLEARVPAQGSAAGTPAKPAPTSASVRDDPSLPRVLLIGDSISDYYRAAVQEALAGKANVHRIPENGGSTRKGLTCIDRWLGNGRWDAIHFNFGIHDMKLIDGNEQVPIDEYERNLRRLVERLKKTKATLIWSTTTPETNVRVCRSEDGVAYNAVAEKVMKQNGVLVNDLYALALPWLGQIHRPDQVHFTPEGSRVLGGQVAAAILKALKKPADTTTGVPETAKK